MNIDTPIDLLAAEIRAFAATLPEPDHAAHAREYAELKASLTHNAVHGTPHQRARARWMLRRIDRYAPR